MRLLCGQHDPLLKPLVKMDVKRRDVGSSAKHWMREIMDHVHDFTVKYKITPATRVISQSVISL